MLTHWVSICFNKKKTCLKHTSLKQLDENIDDGILISSFSRIDEQTIDENEQGNEELNTLIGKSFVNKSCPSDRAV